MNFTAESNRDDSVEYEWVLPNGDILRTKNPSAFSVPYGRHALILRAIDSITQEKVEQSFFIVHHALPKVSSSSS